MKQNLWSKEIKHKLTGGKMFTTHLGTVPTPINIIGENPQQTWWKQHCDNIETHAGKLHMCTTAGVCKLQLFQTWEAEYFSTCWNNNSDQLKVIP